MEKSALVIVDVQNDFCPGGALPVPEGDRVVPVLNSYIEIFGSAGFPVYATRDWHPRETVHFKALGGDWPPHCVRETRGAEFHPDLELPGKAVVITKGEDPGLDSYSGFQGRDASGKPLAESLRERGIKTLFVGGLATDYCVRATVLDGLREGFDVKVLVDAVRGVDIREGDSSKALDEMKRKGAEMVTIDGVRRALITAVKGGGQ